MLENLHVKNLALIEEEDITFLDGLHILSERPVPESPLF